jgi:hemolysin activation/secretion protein
MKELGGNRVLRGYPFSRCIDKSGYALQSELRFPLAGRFGGVAFASCGQVGRSLSDFRISDTRIAAGAGLRVRPNTSSDVNIRLDVAFSPESTGIYITLLEAF